jgi:hypothetical protein
MTQYIKFIRTHKPSGSTFTSTFDKSHGYCFSDDQKDYSYNTMVKVADSLIDKWNKRQPETWSYKIKTEESE